MLLSLCPLILVNEIAQFSYKAEAALCCCQRFDWQHSAAAFAYGLACPSVCLRSKVQYVQTALLLVPYQPDLVTALRCRRSHKLSQTVAKMPEQKQRAPLFSGKLWQSRSLTLVVLTVTWTLQFCRMIWEKWIACLVTRYLNCGFITTSHPQLFWMDEFLWVLSNPFTISENVHTTQTLSLNIFYDI